MDNFRVRLNGVDHYQARPTLLDPPLFDGEFKDRDRLPAVPVIRVFGATETGQKVCAHVHGALPYLFVEYRGKLERQEVKSYMAQLRHGIDQALAKSYRRKPHERALFVGHISLVKAVPFFGYHVGYRYFLKIYMLNPLNMTRFADLLHEGHILGQRLQPFEAHISYLLQWMCDFNIYGCGYVEASRVRFRYPVPNESDISNSQHRWHTGTVGAALISNPDLYPRQSHCSIEVDICVQDIVSRLAVEVRNLHDSFVEHFQPRAPDEKLVHSLKGLWKDETRRRRRRMGLEDTDSSSPFPPEVLVSVSAEPRYENDRKWLHEDEFRGYIDELITAERDTLENSKPEYKDFVNSDPLQCSVQTALESVGDLFLNASTHAYPFDEPLPEKNHFNSFASADFMDSFTDQVADELADTVAGEGLAVDEQSNKSRPEDEVASNLFDLSNTQQNELAQSFYEDEDEYTKNSSGQEDLLRGLEEQFGSPADTDVSDSDLLDYNSPRKRRKLTEQSPQKPFKTQRFFSGRPKVIKHDPSQTRLGNFFLPGKSKKQQQDSGSQDSSQTSIKSTGKDIHPSASFKVAKNAAGMLVPSSQGFSSQDFSSLPLSQLTKLLDAKPEATRDVVMETPASSPPHIPPDVDSDVIQDDVHITTPPSSPPAEFHTAPARISPQTSPLRQGSRAPFKNFTSPRFSLHQPLSSQAPSSAQPHQDSFSSEEPPPSTQPRPPSFLSDGSSHSTQPPTSAQIPTSAEVSYSDQIPPSAQIPISAQISYSDQSPPAAQILASAQISPPNQNPPSAQPPPSDQPLPSAQPPAQQPAQPSAAGQTSFLSTSTSTATSTSSTSKHSPIVWESSQPLKLAASIYNDFPAAKGCQTYCFHVPPPTSEDVDYTIEAFDRPRVIHQDAFFSNPADIPDRPREYGGRRFVLESLTLPYLPEFDIQGESAASRGVRRPVVLDKPKKFLSLRARARRAGARNWEISREPPSYEQVQQWLDEEAEWKEEEKVRLHALDNRDQEVQDEDYLGDDEQVEGRGGEVKDAAEEDAQLGEEEQEEALNVDDEDEHENQFGNQTIPPRLRQFQPPKRSRGYAQILGSTQKPEPEPQRKNQSSVQFQTGYMNIMSLEVHVNSRNDLAPNPEHDDISCVFWCLQEDDNSTENRRMGVLVLADARHTARRLSRELRAEVIEEDTELDLLNKLVDMVRALDPDILTGYEVHQGSWGYLIERARKKYDFNLCDELSRVKSHAHGRFGREADKWGFDHTSTVRVTGRHVINIWRAMRSELNLLQYTMENVCFHLLKRRIPHYSFATLTSYYTSDRFLPACAKYFLSRVQLNLDILDAQELIPRTSEQARLVGVDFFSVFSRGSQFKVESFMFRIAKPENYLLVSPSRTQVGGQNALECLPLVMEPRSAFYSSPMVVLDFQSLYPSIMIAYNYCYSTCLGRIVGWRGTNKMGFADFRRQPGLLELVKDQINISPNGLMFVRPEMRKSLLAKMLGEILETRVMVKSGMKEDREDARLQQLLNNRQLALKLMANVTYGYTSATFSGRMPCAEIADAIVQTARETLERSIALIHSTERWGAEVVYGDTDSLFIHLKGRTRAQAFEIGAEIAQEITKGNPKPVKLKFEKVYQPCVLLTKKRYVGFKYESPDQKEPEFEAKGIETVRRDGTPAEQKIEERALKILFRTADLSLVKRYFQRQCRRIMQGRVLLQDFCYAREVKLGTYSDKGLPPAGALIATKRMMKDSRAEPQYGERVPYVIVTGAPGARLIDRSVHPQSLLQHPDRHDLQLDARYYITKNIMPPLERIFNLMGASVRAWWDATPRVHRARLALPAADGDAPKIRRTIEDYMPSTRCSVCRRKMRLRRGKARMPSTQGHLAAAIAASLGKKPPSQRKQDRTICRNCRRNPQGVVMAVTMRARKAERSLNKVESICRSCTGLRPGDVVRCDSLDCPAYYSRVMAKGNNARAASWVPKLRQMLGRGALDW